MTIKRFYEYINLMFTVIIFFILLYVNKDNRIVSQTTAHPAADK